MVVIKKAKRNRSGKQDKFKDDPLIQLMKSVGIEFDENGRVTHNPLTYSYKDRKEGN